MSVKKLNPDDIRLVINYETLTVEVIDRKNGFVHWQKQCDSIREAETLFNKMYQKMISD